MAQPLHVLILAAEQDGDLLLHALRQGGYEPAAQRVDTTQAMHAALSGDARWQMVVADADAPSFRLSAALDALRQSGADVPFLLVASSPDAEAAVNALKSGVNDCLFKGNLARLASCVERELREAEARRRRRQADEERRQNETRCRSLVDGMRLGVALIGPDLRVLAFNRQLQDWFPRLGGGERPFCYQALRGHASADMCRNCPAALTLEDGEVHREQAEIFVGDESRTFRLISAPVLDDAGSVSAVIQTLEDVTEQRLMEDQMVQTAKMESIGRLAGGVAHDFNNLLTVVNGYAELITRSPNSTPQIRTYAEEILSVSGRAADLTRQLQAFGRRQSLQPVPSNLNDVIEGFSGKLRRMLGDGIELVIRGAEDLGNCRVDRAQIEQVLMNLAANARDAMPEGGRLTVATANVEVGWRLSMRNRGMKPGSYVMVSVADTGCGMDQATLQQIFEPFFTTKDVGEGSGLGLATAYGIVSQHEGCIVPESEVDKGSVFRIYLPRVAETAEAPRRAAVRAEAPKGSETILLAEDEDGVRYLVQQILQERGYEVVAASCADEAEEVFRGRDGDFDLLLTDVVMPGRNGRELYVALSQQRPLLKVLYMSGYTADAIAEHGVLGPEIAFLQKPFTSESLARNVREVLDQPMAASRQGGA